ncbi:MAG: outer membrane protein assembly factor BamB [Flavobacteriales bacterium]|nr:outer membrane protein assembly factor BamB [Flavobacteriales bacterium]
MGYKRVTQIALLGAILLGCANEQTAVRIAPLPNVENEFNLSEAWTKSVGKGVGTFYSQLTPVYAYEKVFAADRNGEISAFDPETGKPIWSVNLGLEKPTLISSGVIASYDKVYVGTEMGFLIALDAETGDFIWQKDLGGELLSKPLADSNQIFVNTSRGELVAVDAETGTEKWRISNDVPNLTLRGDSAPVAVSGGIFWGLANGRLSAAFIENGTPIWQQVIASPKGATEIDRLVDVDATPVISDYLLYAIGYNGHLVAIDLRSGQPVWKREYSSANDFSVFGNTLYLITEQDHLVAVDARSGTERWKNADLENRQLTQPTLIAGKLVVGDAEGYLHWLNPESGEFIAQHQIDSSGFAVPPIQMEDNFLVMTRDGKMAKIPSP